MQQATPSPALAPAAPAQPAGRPQISFEGTPISDPMAVYQGYRAQRRELGRQLESLEISRGELSQRLEQPNVGGPDRRGLEQRIAAVDERIASLDKQIAESDALVARSAAIPGATADPPQLPDTGPPEEAFVLGGLFIMFVLLPLSVGYARRLWKRGAQVVATFPREIAERLARVEQSVEATAIEIERIGEGQRFMTRLFTEGPAAHALSAGTPDAAGLPQRPGDARP